MGGEAEGEGGCVAKSLEQIAASQHGSAKRERLGPGLLSLVNGCCCCRSCSFMVSDKNDGVT